MPSCHGRSPPQRRTDEVTISALAPPAERTLMSVIRPPCYSLQVSGMGSNEIHSVAPRRCSHRPIFGRDEKNIKSVPRLNCL